MDSHHDSMPSRHQVSEALRDPALAIELRALREMIQQGQPAGEARRRSQDWKRVIGPLVRAQAAFPPIPKLRRATESSQDKETGALSTKSFMYADLADCLKAVLPALNANGFYLSQSTERVDGGWVLLTELLHDSGEWLAGLMPMPDLRRTGDPQEFASMVTLWRRYALCPLLGIATEEAVQESRYTQAYEPPAIVAAEVAAAQGPVPSGAAATDPAPAPQGDISDKAVRTAMVRALNATMVDLGKTRNVARAEEAWLQAAALLRGCRPDELAMIVDTYRQRLQAEPPAIRDLAYPPVVER